MRENCIIVLPVNILTGVARRLLGLHDTTVYLVDMQQYIDISCIILYRYKIKLYRYIAYRDILTYCGLF